MFFISGKIVQVCVIKKKNMNHLFAIFMCMNLSLLHACTYKAGKEAGTQAQKPGSIHCTIMSDPFIVSSIIPHWP